MFVGLGVFCMLGFLLSSSESNPITNTNFNEHIREFSLKDNNSTVTNTLHKEGLGQRANFALNNRIIKHSDNVISASSHNGGLSHHEYQGYGIHEEAPYYYGEGHLMPIDHGIHGYEHGYHEAHGHSHASHGHNVGHYQHALAAKAVLWPLAGIALLGAAAALVSNPVLLQLAVATGKRRRRDADPDMALVWLQDNPKMRTAESSNGTKSDQLPKPTSSKMTKKKIRYTIN